MRFLNKYWFEIELWKQLIHNVIFFPSLDVAVIGIKSRCFPAIIVCMGSFHLLANMSKWREKNTSKGTIQIQTQCKKKTAAKGYGYGV